MYPCSLFLYICGLGGWNIFFSTKEIVVLCEAGIEQSNIGNESEQVIRPFCLDSRATF